MNAFGMKKFGIVLTGRDYGKAAARQILESLSFPITLDFADILSVGSSFGDEVVSAVAARQGGRLTILNAASIVRNSLEQSAKDHGVTLAFH